MEEARVGEKLDARTAAAMTFRCCWTRRPTSLPEMSTLDTAERCIEPRRIVVVGKANSDTLCSEITRPVEIASACDHSVGGNSPEEFGDDESTQPTSRCG